MATTGMLVNLGVFAAVTWIVWYFWLSEKKGARPLAADGSAQEAYIRVKGGYEPDVIVVEAGRPVRLHFRRQETAACSEVVVFPDYGVTRTLPAGQTVTIELPPSEPGEYKFACQMGMLRGRLVVVAGARRGALQESGPGSERRAS